MPRGPKPKPPELRALDGRGHVAKVNHPVHDDNALPEPPDHMGDIAADEWRRLAALLHPMGMLADAYLGPFAALCEAYGEWQFCEADIRQHGYVYELANGTQAKRAIVGVRDKARDTYYRIAAGFGLTPADNGRINLPNLKAKDDPLEEMLKRRRQRA